MHAFKIFDFNSEALDHALCACMTDTDEVSACILLIRKDLAGRKGPKRKQAVVRKQYIHDLTGKECKELSARKVVGINPNKSDRLFCTSEETTKQYRYTQNKRRKDTKSNKYKQILLNEKNHTLVDGRSIIEWKKDLSTQITKQYLLMLLGATSERNY